MIGVLSLQIELKVETQLKRHDIPVGAILPPPIDDVIGGDTKRACARVKEEGGAVPDAIFAVGFTNYPIERSREGGRKFKLGSTEPSGDDRSGLLFALDRWQHHFTDESEGPFVTSAK